MKTTLIHVAAWATISGTIGTFIGITLDQFQKQSERNQLFVIQNSYAKNSTASVEQPESDSTLIPKIPNQIKNNESDASEHTDSSTNYKPQKQIGIKNAGYVKNQYSPAKIVKKSIYKVNIDAIQGDIDPQKNPVFRNGHSVNIDAIQGDIDPQKNPATNRQ